MRRHLVKRVLAAGTSVSALGMSLLAAWYWLSPSMTLENMANAASRRDGKGVAAYMDMDALRASTRQDAENALRNSVPSNNVFLNHRAITEALVGKIIDDIFSPQGTRRLVEGQSDPAGNRHALAYRIILNGPNRFVARIDAPERVDLLFIRHGADWLLSAIHSRPEEPPEKYT